MKYLTDDIAEDYKAWLRSRNNPNYTGQQKYDDYHNYLDRLLVRAVELNKIEKSQIIVTDINWLNEFKKIYESSPLLQDADKSIANGGGIASLKRFIDFIKFKQNQVGNISKDRDALFVEYLKDCAEKAGKQKSSYLGYRSALIRWWERTAKQFSDKISVFDYDNAIEFKSFAEQHWNGGDPDSKRGIELYTDLLSDNKEVNQGVEVKMGNVNKKDKELNLILYGPPGTGKTYKTVIKAVEIIEGSAPENYDEALKCYRKLMDDGRIAFTTFHQSYGYEEFIEGIKPVSKNGEVKYEVCSGVFKEFCDVAKKHLKTEKSGSSTLEDELDLIKPNATVWKISLDSAGRKGFEFHDKCLEEDCIRVGWDENEDLSLVTEDGKESAKRFISEMKIGDIVLSCYSQNEIDAIGVITGDYEWHDDEPRLKRFRQVKWLKKWTGETKYNIVADNSGSKLTQTTLYKLWRISIDKIKQIVSSEPKETIENVADAKQSEDAYVFIIDEINRGNVSKIFGELITLIEPTKRLGADEAMKCTLPYSSDKFGVPKNVYILGTMNTADRSLVQLDAALRRRFAFEEMMPNYKVIQEKVGTVSDIDIAALLQAINERISVRLDREHQIGHSYFMKLNGNSNIADVKEIFKKNIIPLLQEYFFDDYNSIKEVLNNKFVTEEDCKYDKDKKVYKIDISEAQNKDFIEIYGGNSKNESANNTND